MLKLRTDFKSPALLFSGGAESTLLYCLYSKIQINLKLYVLNRHNNPIQKSFNIHNYLHNTYGYNSIIEIYEIPEMNTYEQIDYSANKLHAMHDVIIFGGNKYPSDPTIRPKFIESYISQTWLDCNQHIYAPLMAYDKSDIINMYFENGLQDVLPLTHSCGNNNSEPCGICFNCRERLWAYQKLDLPPCLGV